MAPFFNRMEIQKGRCGKMSQDSGKGLRPRQYGGTNQLAEDRLERKESTYVERTTPGRQADNIS